MLDHQRSRRPAKRALALVFLLAPLFVACPATTPAGAPADSATKAAGATWPRTVTIVGLSDFHGALEPQISQTKLGEPVERGGAALIAAYVSRIRGRTDGPVLVVDGGDMFQGSLVSNLAEGAPVVRFYNRLGLVSATVGNHEFDFGPAGERTVPLDDGDDPRGALKERIAEAQFPFLAANVVDESGRIPPWLRPSTQLTVDGVKVAVVGAATPDTPLTTTTKNLVGLSFLPPLGPVVAEGRRLREAGAQVLVLSLHEGGHCESNIDPEDLASCSGPVFDFVRSLPEGLFDVVLGAHTHGGIAKRVGRTAILEPFAQGRYLAWATVHLDGAPPDVHGPVPTCGSVVETPQGPSCDPKVVRTVQGPARPAVFMGKRVAADDEVARLLAPDLAHVEALQREPLGARAERPIARAYSAESALGNLAADVFREALPDVDAACTNGGGLRADLPAGELAYGHVFTALPFDNRLTLLTVDGETLARIVRLGHAGGHGALSWSGLTFEARECEVTRILVKGEPLDPARTYRVVTNDYLAGGGSGFSDLGLSPEQIQVFWDRPFLRDLVAARLSELGPLLKPEQFHDPAAPRQRIEGECQTRKE